jgi:hypothetical protein
MPPPPPSHPLPAMTTFELSRLRRDLEHALKSLPTTAAERAQVQQQLTAVIAEQESRNQTPATGG